MKLLEFVGASRDELLSFPRGVQREMGFQLDRVQNSLLPDDSKAMTTIGAGVFEIRARDESGAYRTIYSRRCQASRAKLPIKNPLNLNQQQQFLRNFA